MKRPKIILYKSPNYGYRYKMVAKNGRVLTVSDQFYKSRSHALRGAKDLIKTCLIMYKERSVRITDG
jgi:uncharacterized protein YegP (UPF0339 family)